MPTSPEPLPEEVWRRILARAAEIDARDGTTLPIEDLRRAALEAGISASAFDRALEEAPLAADVSVAPIATLKALLPPLAALGSFWASLAVLARAAFFMGAGWELRAGVNLAALAIGVAVGKLLGARRTAVILMGVAASQAALLFVRLVWGLPSAQGIAINWLAMVAGVGGALLATMRPPWRARLAIPPAPPPSARSEEIPLDRHGSSDDTGDDVGPLRNALAPWGLTTA